MVVLQSVSEMTLPPHLVDVTSVLRGALPVLPRSLAALCLTLNILLPGLGTAASGWLGLCWGRNRMGTMETTGHRFTSVVVTAVTGFVQLFTVTFFLVGWFWGVAWGILLVSIANKYAHFLSEHRTSLTGAVSLEMLAVNAS
nr:protein stum-like [Procambarus clarkii]